MINKLTNEQNLFLLLSRLTFTKENEMEIEKLINSDIDWHDIFRMAVKNKVTQLIWKNLYDKKYEYKMPVHLNQICKNNYLGTKKKNEIHHAESQRIIRALRENDVITVPLKGAYLIPNMYKDFGIRMQGDTDLLVSKKDSKVVSKVLKQFEYIQGDYDPDTRSVAPLTREKEILWKMKMTNLYPYLKVQKDLNCEVLWFDFSTSLDYDLNYDIVEEMLINSYYDVENMSHILQPSDFFIQLCCHLYKEAYNPVNVYLYKDLNVIKFLDVREYTLKYMKDSDFDQVIKVTQKYGYQDAIYFTIYYLREIYNDGYETALLNKFDDIDESKIIENYGGNDYKNEDKWKSSFWNRLFSDHNFEEIENRPVYY